MDFLISALYVPLRVALWTALFPWRYVALPLVQVCYGIVNHFLFIPAYLVFRTMVYAFIYIPLKPMLFVANVHYDTLVPVEVTVFRLATRLVPHLQVFLTHFIHYFMISLFMGSFVGAIAGLNISLVARVLSISEEEAKSQTKTQKFDAPFKRPSYVSSAQHDTKRVKTEPGNEEKTGKKDDKTQTLENSNEKTPPAAVKIEPRVSPLGQVPELAEFSTEALFEDDDGYDFMTYQPSEEQKKPPSQKKEIYSKRREGRYRTLPASLQSTIQSTIEEESESEITPTPTHAATSAMAAPNHLTLDYATGTIGSSKTISTESSVFSKTLGATRSGRGRNGISRDETDLSGEETERVAKKSDFPRPSEKDSDVSSMGDADADPDKTYLQDLDSEDGSDPSTNSRSRSDNGSEK